METAEEIKTMVKEKYGKIAEDNELTVGCCGSTCGCDSVTNIMSDDYAKVEGYNPAADLGLGCGIPTEFANIKEGHVVLDLGSGAGNDAFVARKIVGEKGSVIGVDMTQAMIDRARKNNEKMGYSNVEFRLGEIENMPVATQSVDVVVSNCVLNLVPNKINAFREVYRVLKPGAHFSISDIVLDGELPENIQKAAEMYAGCVSGAIQKDDYLHILKKTGFQDIRVVKEKTIKIPDEILSQYLSPKDIETFKQSGAKILSITVYAEKNKLIETSSCCSDGDIVKSKAGGCGCN